MAARTGDWIQTATGGQFWPMDPQPDEIDINVIAHALSMLCRFGGHCLRFYSVAEHSVLLSRHVAPEYAFWALMHDATEAYLVDMPRPIKRFLPGYAETEERIEAAVAARFGLSLPMPASVKDADRRILTDESQQNMAECPVEWSTAAEPLGVTLEYWSPALARHEFLTAFHRLTGLAP